VYASACGRFSRQETLLLNDISLSARIVKVFGDRSVLPFCDMVGCFELLLMGFLVAVTGMRFPFISVRSACRIVVRGRRRVVAVRVITDVRGALMRMRFCWRRRFVRVWRRVAVGRRRIRSCV